MSDLKTIQFNVADFPESGTINGGNSDAEAIWDTETSIIGPITEMIGKHTTDADGNLTTIDLGRIRSELESQLEQVATEGGLGGLDQASREKLVEASLQALHASRDNAEMVSSESFANDHESDDALSILKSDVEESLVPNLVDAISSSKLSAAQVIGFFANLVQQFIPNLYLAQMTRVESSGKDSTEVAEPVSDIEARLWSQGIGTEEEKGRNAA